MRRNQLRRAGSFLLRSLVVAAAALVPLIPAPSVQAAEAPPIEWVRQFGSTPVRNNYALAAAAGDGSIYVAGVTSSSFSGQTNAGKYDVFVCKRDSSGNELWTRQFGTSASDSANAITVDATSIYMAGDTWGVLPGQTNAGGLDAFVRKYDGDGNELWTRQFGSSQGDWAYGISVDATDVYVAGYTLGVLPSQTSAGSEDPFVRKYDSNGNELWTRQFGTHEWDWSSAVSAEPNGVYVVGGTFGDFPGQTRPNGGDAFVRRYAGGQFGGRH